MSRGTILFVDDDRELCTLVADGLTRRGFAVEWRTSAADALAALGPAVDVVVTDLNMPGADGLALCKRVRELRPDVPVVVVTAFGSLETAIGGIRAGAWDFLTKPFEMDVLAIAVERAVSHGALQSEVRRLRATVASADRVGALVGGSAPMRRLFDLIDRVASVDVTALLAGESGTGKELVARALHERGARSKGPFVAINCAALPEPLLESELFGHVRGAFTDARTAKTGLFFQASGGTLLLDEVGDLPISLQPKLLRALQDRTARPLGGDRELPFDVRLVCATHRDLEALVEEGRFRQDLFYRINVVRLEIPPLRTRGEDVLLLAQHFLAGSAARFGKAVDGFTGEVARRLLAYDWPGNVRELQNCIERAVALTPFDHLTVEDLPDRIRAWRPGVVTSAPEDTDGMEPLEAVERRHVLRVLAAVDGSRTRAAKVLGLDRKTLYRRLLRWGHASDEDAPA